MPVSWFFNVVGGTCGRMNIETDMAFIAVPLRLVLGFGHAVMLFDSPLPSCSPLKFWTGWDILPLICRSVT